MPNQPSSYEVFVTFALVILLAALFGFPIAGAMLNRPSLF